MTWNYRLFHQPTPQGHDFYFVGECYYDDKTGEPILHSSTEHNHLIGENAIEVADVYEMVAEAFKAPVIELDQDGDFMEVSHE